jgi:hypothetical protein
VIYDSRTQVRPSCRTPLAIHVAVFTILIALFSAVAPRVSHAQAASTLPKSWNDAVAKLGDEVAAAMSPAAVTLSVNNISSLDASHAGAVEAAVREQLQRHSFSFAPANTLAAQSAFRLRLSLSESAAEYVWVMQVFNDSSDGASSPVIIVAAPKTDSAHVGADEQSLSLERRFVWKQLDRFLDFALLKNPASGESELLVLETKRFAVYKVSGVGWQLSRSTPIPQVATPSRDPEGWIDLKTGKISLKGLECVGDPDLAGVLQCKASTSVIRSPIVKIPGLLNSVGAGIEEKCRDEIVWLATADSDWTQSDSIRGYLTKGIPLPLIPSGNTLEFDGPVMALYSDQVANSARAVVHNLKTREYEGYIVTATCSN